MKDEQLLDYYWKYFELHSNQRMQMVNFYITIEVVLIGALFALIGLDNRMQWAEKTVSIAIAACSLTFYLLDARTKFLIKQSESCMKSIEDRFDGTYDEKFKLLNTIDNKTKGVVLRNTYSRVFFFVYLVIGLFGLYTLFCI